MIRLTRRYRFPAAHVLCNPSLPDDENRRIFGKCANPQGHGHDYGVEVSVEGRVDEAMGEVVSLELLDAIFDEAVRERFSHRMLNEVAPFAGGPVPTAENIAVAVHEALAEPIARRSRARLAGVRVVETERNSFEYGEMR